MTHQQPKPVLPIQLGKILHSRSDELSRFLATSLNSMEILPTSKQWDRIAQWVALLEEQNQVINLTALKGWKHILAYLVFPSLVAIPLLRGNSVVDIGSGGGIPGILLAIACEDIHFTLIERCTKKAVFLERCVSTLALEHQVQVLNQQAEQTASIFSTIIARGIGNLEKFMKMTHHLGDNASVWITYKGKTLQQEQRTFQKQYRRENWKLQARKIKHCSQFPLQLSLLALTKVLPLDPRPKK